MSGSVDFASAWGNPLASAQAGNDYVNKLFDQSAQLQAGRQYVSGDTGGAADTLARRGNIAAAEDIRMKGALHFQAQHAFLQQAVPQFQQILDKAGPQAVVSAFDTLSPYLQNGLGIPPDQIAVYRQKLQTDPAGTLQALGAGATRQFEYKQNGDETLIFDPARPDPSTGGPLLVGKYVGTKFQTVGPGGAVIQTGGDGSSATAPSAPGGLQPAPAATLAPPSAGSPPPPAAAMPRAEQVAPLLQRAIPGLVITGMGRTPGQNLAVNGVPNSDHLQDHALDVRPLPGMPFEQFRQLALASGSVPANAQFVDETAPGAPHSTGPHWHVGWSEDRGQQQPAAALRAMAPPTNGGDARVVYQAPPKPGFRALSAAELQQYPGAIQINDETHEVKYPPSSVAAGSPVDDKTVDYLAHRYLSGDTAVLTGLGRNGTNKLKVIQRAQEITAALNGTPEGDAAAAALRSANSAALRQNTTMGANIGQAENTALRNADLMLSLAPAGVGPAKTPILDAWIQAGRKATGDPDVAKFDLALKTFANEYSRVMSGGTGGAPLSDAARRETDALLSNNLTFDQLKGIVSTMRQDMANRKAGIQEEHDALFTALGGRAGASAATPGQKPIKVDINGKVIP